MDQRKQEKQVAEVTVSREGGKPLRVRNAEHEVTQAGRRGSL